MYRQIGRIVLTWMLSLAWLGTTWAAPAKAAKKQNGFQFPPIQVPYFQYKPGNKFQKKTISFKPIVGKKPFVMFYFLPQAKRTVTELQAFATASKVFGNKIQFFAVTKGTTPDDVKKAYNKVKELKIQIPVLLDEKGLIAYVMLTRRVPAYAMVTKSGRFTLARAGALTEKIDANNTLLSLISYVANGGEPAFTVAPGYSPNPYNLVGQKAKSFQAVNALSPDTVNLQNYVKKDKRPVLLAFWSITCPHCQKTMPILARYARANKKRMRMLTMAVIHKDEYKTKLKAYLKKHNLSFKVYNDPKGKIFNDYMIMTVPTLFLLDNKGVIRNAMLGGGKNANQELDKLLDSLEKLPNNAAPRRSPPRRPAPTSRPTPQR